jgi:hypothetical protein
MWNFFKSIQCIHIQERTDRYQSVIKSKTALNIPLSLHLVKKHPVSGVQGAFESHVQVARQNKHLDNCLIFEDDFEPTLNFSEQMLQECIHFMKFSDWDIFFLGCFTDNVSFFQTNVHGHIYKVTATCFHAYVLSKVGMEKVSNLQFRGIPVDDVYKNLNAYAILPGLFQQILSPTNVSSLSFISTFKFRHQIENLNQWYAMEFGVPLRYCVVLVAWYYFLVLLIKNGNFKA